MPALQALGGIPSDPVPVPGEDRQPQSGRRGDGGWSIQPACRRDQPGHRPPAGCGDDAMALTPPERCGADDEAVRIAQILGESEAVREEARPEMTCQRLVEALLGEQPLVEERGGCIGAAAARRTHGLLQNHERNALGCQESDLRRERYDPGAAAAFDV